MKLPSKLKYAYKAVLELSLRHRDSKNPMAQLSEISRLQNIPKEYLVQILLRLKQAGIVKTSRGTAGGYHLAKIPAEITLLDVVRALDGSLLEKTGMSGKTDNERLLSSLWDQINSEIEKLLEKNFDELVSELQGMQVVYHI